MRTARAKRTQKTHIFSILPHRAGQHHFEDTHVMETRHPLTIPAAIVLGTAVVATALPLPSSTPATATGTAHVTRLHGQIHARTGQAGDDHGRDIDRGKRPLLRQP